MFGNQFDMFGNYFKTAARNLVKTKLFTLVNILGLAVGMAACLLILHYVSFEKSYDRFHEDGDRVFRLRYERSSAEGKTVKFASCSPPVATFIRGVYPEVEQIARLFRYRAVVSFGDRQFTEERMYFAEPDFLDILKFKFRSGDPLRGIVKANNAFISATTARKYFGDQDPMGKWFSVDKKTDYQVAGVFEDVPANSHLKFDILLSFENILNRFGKDVMESWGHTGFYTYMRLVPGTDPAQLEQKFARMVTDRAGELEKQYKVKIYLKMQPLRDIHLTSHFMQEYEINGDGQSVNFLFIIAIFIIIMAWVNYINLSTARSLTRAREVGLRKVVGATRQKLMAQFFMEILLINLAAVVFSLFLVKSVLPFFNQITGTPASFGIWTESWFWLVVPLMLLMGVFLSGLYPVVVLSSFQPAAVLKGKLGNSARGINLRKILVAFQFVMAFVLITGTIGVYRQLNYMKNQALGFNMDQVLVLKAPRVRDKSFAEKFVTFKESLLSHSEISKLCVTTEVPGRQILWDAGSIRRAGESEAKGKNYQIMGVDYDFLEVFDLELVTGRNFSKEFPSDNMGLILNETAVAWMGFSGPEAAVGQRVDYWGEIYTIVGVLKDYHHESLKAAYEPQIFRLMLHGRGVRGHFAVKIATRDVKQAVELIERRYAYFFPGNPLEYFFLDDYYNQQYRGDERFGSVFGLFAFLAVFITALGLSGLSSFMALQRTKEIGIRKALGATVPKILLLFSKDFMKLLLAAFGLALPVCILALDSWLGSFANRMSQDGWLYLLPLVTVIAITLLTVSINVLKAALMNPVKSLRCE